MGISENIKILRKIYNLTQDELAEIAGVSNRAVSTWEIGNKEPRMGAIQKMADHFGIKKSNIIEDGGMSPERIAQNFEEKNLKAELLDLIAENKLVVGGKHLDPDRLQLLIEIVKAFVK